MAYTAFTFTAGQTPTTAVWNQLTGNDAFFYALLVGSGVLTSTVLTNPVKFSVYRNAPQSIGANSLARVQFDTKTFDTGSNFDATTNFRFIAPAAGFYQLQATIGVSAAASKAYIAIFYKNGAEFRRGNQLVNGVVVSDVNVSVADLMQLATNDYIEVFVYNGDAGNNGLQIGPNRTYFSGFLVSST